MIIGHIPAGYISSKLLLRRFVKWSEDSRKFVCAGILGAITPDVDMVYFQFIDHRLHHHHTYITHLPILWGPLLLASAIWLRLGRGGVHAALAMIFSLNGFVHLLLQADTDRSPVSPKS